MKELHTDEHGHLVVPADYRAAWEEYVNDDDDDEVQDEEDEQESQIQSIEQ